jgi:hypothetical protein
VRPSPGWSATNRAATRSQHACTRFGPGTAAAPTAPPTGSTSPHQPWSTSCITSSSLRSRSASPPSPPKASTASPARLDTRRHLAVRHLRALEVERAVLRFLRIEQGLQPFLTDVLTSGTGGSTETVASEQLSPTALLRLVDVDSECADTSISEQACNPERAAASSPRSR